MAGRRKRRRHRDRPGADHDPHGDGMGGQGDLLSDGSPAEVRAASGENPGEGDAARPTGSAEDAPPAGDEAGEEFADAAAPPAKAAAPAPSPAASPAPREAPAPKPPADPVQEALDRARALVGDGRIREAIDRYRSLVTAHPDSLRARNNLGVLYDELGQHALALEQFEAARDLEPENVEVLTNLGASLGWVGRFEDAERELRRAQKLDPDAVDVRANLGILYYRRGLYAPAEAELRWVCDRDHDHGPAHFYRGEALNRLGKVDDAMEVLERATHLQPENSKAFYTLGILFDKKHMPQEAERMYRRARELARP